MEDIKQYVIDYLEGRVQSKEFIKELQKDTKIMDWLQSIVPEGKIGYFEKITNDDGTWYQRTGPFLIKHTLDVIWEELPESELGKEYETFCAIARLMKESFPQEKINLDRTLEKKSKFLMDACPEYLDSIEISSAGILDKLMEELPEDMPKTKRIKQFKEKLKAMFYVEGQKYPRWLQGSEWPLSKTGKPTKFLRQKAKGEVSYYYFLDMDTNEEIEVMQAF